jgi:hypothetical protein
MDKGWFSEYVKSQCPPRKEVGGRLNSKIKNKAKKLLTWIERKNLTNLVIQIKFYQIKTFLLRLVRR